MDTPDRPAALPLWALVLAVVGLCFPPLLLVALVLAIVSLTRKDWPGYAARRGLAIAALAISLGAVPLAGVVAAIAVPNLARFQARARMAACKGQLEQALAAERTYREAHGRFSTHPAELGLAGDPHARLLLRLDGVGPLSPPGAAVAPEAVGLLFPGDEALDEGLPEEVRGQLGIRGACPDCAVTLACAANLDGDPTLDVWSISSGPRARPGGEPVPAGALFHHVDDATEEVQPLPPFGLPGAVAPPAAAAAPLARRAPEATDDAEPHTWQTYSFDGRTGLKETAVGDRCLLTCTREDGSRVWEVVGACQASKGERRFLSPDGERLVVLVPAPARGKAWTATEVMRVYRRGELAYAVMGATVLPERAMQASTTWLQGTFGAPGEEPRYAPDGLAVEYTTIAGVAGRVPLRAEAAADAGAPGPAPSPARKPKKKAKR